MFFSLAVRGTLVRLPNPICEIVLASRAAFPRTASYKRQGGRGAGSRGGEKAYLNPITL